MPPRVTSMSAPTEGKAYEHEKILVRRAGDQESINIQEIGNLGKYLVGKYDLEIPIYPLMQVEDVEISRAIPPPWKYLLPAM